MRFVEALAIKAAETKNNDNRVFFMCYSPWEYAVTRYGVRCSSPFDTDKA